MPAITLVTLTNGSQTKFVSELLFQIGYANDGRKRIVRYTASATLKLTDSGCIIECDSATPMTLTVPANANVPYKSGVDFEIVQIGVGSVTVVGDTGVTVESGNLVLNSKDSSGYLYQRDTLNDFVFISTPPATWATLTGIPANVSSLASLVGAANYFPAFSGVGTLILKAISNFGYSLVAAVDAAAAKALLLLAKSDVGLGNVDNTSDINKPVSTATQTAIDASKIKYWAEASSAHPVSPSDTQLLAWQPKDPNGTFVLAKTVMNIPVKQGITLRDPLESGASFPANFITGLDLQIKGATGTNTTYARGGYCFGEGNTTYSATGIAVGINNRSGSTGAPTGGITFGKNNIATQFFGNEGVAIGYGCSVRGGVGLGRNATTQLGVVAGQDVIDGGSLQSALYGATITSNGDINISVGIGNTLSVASGQSISVGQSITSTAPKSIVLATSIGSVNPSDQGINGFDQFGRKAAISLYQQLTGITDWTNTAWRDVTAGAMNDVWQGNTPSKFSAHFMCQLSAYSGGGVPAIPTRLGVIRIEAWRNSASLVPTIKLLEGGDANFLTYFDFQFVNFGSGVKLQWKFALDPSGASPNTGRVDIWGELNNASAFN